MTRTYSELAQITSFIDRFKYLKLSGLVGQGTFGHDRYLNQRFYTSAEWRSVRHRVIARDLGCDLGIEGREVFRNLHVHHMNPATPNDFVLDNPDVFDPEYLITTTHRTHNAIHYGSEDLLETMIADRIPGDTKLWN